MGLKNGKFGYRCFYPNEGNTHRHIKIDTEYESSDWELQTDI